MTLNALALDRVLRERGARTLDPNREHPSSLVSLIERGADASRHAELERAVCVVVTAMLEAFPGNVFWDLDALVASLSKSTDILGAAERIARLQVVFGAASSIRFRYVHDFTYGFDWAKWVRRGEDVRKKLTPFEPAFVEALLERGSELVALIERDDELYPKLPNGALRNPFAFSREPADEERLLRSLVASGDVPFETWRWDAVPRHDRDFSAIRRQRALELGISQR